MSANTHDPEWREWAEDLREDWWHISQMLGATESRPTLTPDQRQFLIDFRALVEALPESGALPDIAWSVEIQLENSDNLFGGTHTYRITASDESVLVEDMGIEWQQGVGSDSVPGREFRYSPGERPVKNGVLGSFAQEWEEAVVMAKHVVLRLDCYVIGKLPDAKEDGTAESMKNGLLRQIAIDLQEIQSELFGDDCSLQNAWDEICVQRQTEESLGWDVYELSIRSEIQGLLEELDSDSLLKLWLLTDDGFMWDEESDGPAAPDRACVEEWLYGEVLNLAETYHNPRIIEFVNRSRD